MTLPINDDDHAGHDSAPDDIPPAPPLENSHPSDPPRAHAGEEKPQAVPPAPDQKRLSRLDAIAADVLNQTKELGMHPSEALTLAAILLARILAETNAPRHVLEARLNQACDAVRKLFPIYLDVVDDDDTNG